MIKIEKINDLKVKPIKTQTDCRPVKGGAILGDSPYINIMQVASTAGGKTTATFKILKEAVMPKKTIIVAFVPSIYNDDNWIAIRDYFEDRGTQFIAYTSTKDENGKDLLKQYVDIFKEEAEERENQKRLAKEKLLIPHINGKVNICFNDDDEEEKKEKKCKYRYAEYIFIFDDISDELRGTSYDTLMKKARHYKLLTITSSQDMKDIKPSTIHQMRIWLMFKNIDEQRLLHVYSILGLHIPFDLFYQCYQHATKDTPESSYNFFYLQPRSLEMRRNFSDKFNLT